MKYFFSILFLLSISFLFSCSSDSNSNNPTSGYICEMNITGDINLDFKTNNVVLIPPSQNPNYIFSASLIEDGKTHVFSMTIDKDWADKKEIDLSRDNNLGTFQYNGGEDGKTYRVVSGTLSVETLSIAKLKGTLNFKAAKIGTTDVFIEVKNGKINKNL